MASSMAACIFPAQSRAAAGSLFAITVEDWALAELCSNKPKKLGAA
jgi:hypothetical protein